MASKLLSSHVGHISVVITFLEGEQFLIVYFISYLLQTMLSRVRFRGSSVCGSCCTRWLNGWRHILAVLFEGTEGCDICKYIVYIMG
jgi:hypothetical protein